MFLLVEGAHGFNPRPYVRGDIEIEDNKMNKISFNPRPYVRGD